MRFLNKYLVVVGAMLLLVSCRQRQERVVTPYGSVLDSVEVTEDFDLADIQTNGELIMATVSGPETYYDYHGRQLGTQYLICQHFADSLGVRLRIDVCRDSAELRRRLDEGEADIVAWPTPGEIEVGAEKPEQAVSSHITISSSSPIVVTSVGTGGCWRLSVIRNPHSTPRRYRLPERRA